MTDVLTASYLKIASQNDSWGYRYLDGSGQVLATVVQVVGAEPPKGFFARHLSTNSHNLSRIVLRVDGPAGPLFFLDRAGVAHATSVQPPCAVVAPDGRVLGRVVHVTAAFGQSLLAGMRDRAVHGREIGRLKQIYQQSYQLLDDQNRPLGKAVWEEVKMYARSSDFGSDLRSKGGNHCLFTDTQGVTIARYEADGDLEVTYQLPHPLRTLVIAAPIAMALMTAATVM